VKRNCPLRRGRLAFRSADLETQLQQDEAQPTTKQIDLGGGKSRPRRSVAKPSKAGFFSSWQVTAAFILALVTLTGSAFLAASIVAPESVIGAWSPLAWVHDRRAESLLEKAKPTPQDLQKAESESWTALSQAPVDDVAWLDLALNDRIRNGRLTSRGILYLERSYDVAPFGPDTSVWRIRFTLNNWAALTPELRKDVTDEFKAEWTHAADQLQALQTQVNNPSGRLALGLMISLNSTQAG